MLIKPGNFDFTEVWDGVLYKKLSHYPDITDWEIRNIIDFMAYEKANGRDCTIECADSALYNKIMNAISSKDLYASIPRPVLIAECTACPYRKGCVTDFVCHTTPPENAVSIFASGKLLSAVKARGLSAEILMKESRNAAKDPADYFDYIMFSWGNCQAGDRLVMERKLKRFPNEDDLSINFTPGIRFYFRYDKIIKHPEAVIDGVLPVKIRDELILADWVYRIVIPGHLKSDFENIIPENLKSKVIYIDNDQKDIWEWSEKVYRIIESL